MATKFIGPGTSLLIHVDDEDPVKCDVVEILEEHCDYCYARIKFEDGTQDAVDFWNYNFDAEWSFAKATYHDVVLNTLPIIDDIQNSTNIMIESIKREFDTGAVPVAVPKSEGFLSPGYIVAYCVALWAAVRVYGYFA